MMVMTIIMIKTRMRRMRIIVSLLMWNMNKKRVEGRSALIAEAT